jgi:hypothetical protein
MLIAVRPIRPSLVYEQNLSPVSCSYPQRRGDAKPWLCVALLGVSGACGRIGFDAVGVGGTDASKLDVASTDGSGTCGTVTTCPAMSESILVGSTGSSPGDTSTHGDGMTGSCGATGASDFAIHYTVTPVIAGNMTFHVDATFDTVLYVLEGTDCSASEVACMDNPGASGETATFSFLIVPRELTFVVDGKAGACGSFTLTYSP